MADNTHLIEVRIDTSQVPNAMGTIAKQAETALAKVASSIKANPVSIIAPQGTAEGGIRGGAPRRSINIARAELRGRLVSEFERDFGEGFGDVTKSGTPRVSFVAAEKELLGAFDKRVASLEQAARSEAVVAERILKNQARSDAAKNAELLASRKRLLIDERAGREVLAQQRIRNELLTLQSRTPEDVKAAGDLRGFRKIDSDRERTAAAEIAVGKEATAVRVERIVAEQKVTASTNRELAVNTAAINARIKLSVSEIALANQKAQELIVSGTLLQTKANTIFREKLAAERLGLAVAQQSANDSRLVTVQAKRIVQENALAEQLRLRVIAEAENAGLSRRAARRLASSGGGAGGGGGQGGGLLSSGFGGSFFGRGFASVIRFGLPSAVLFGGARGLSSVIKEAEELVQITIRLEQQFSSLERQGVQGANASLDEFKNTLKDVALETGLGTEQIFELGTQLVGLFASFDDQGNFAEAASNTTRLVAQLARISGLEVEETFNDLAGAVRSFAETGAEAEFLIENLADDLISIADVTGVRLGELLDFLGRVGPIAAQAGFELDELASIGATILQGSAVGGAALSEQFARILSGFTSGLGEDIALIAVEFEDIFGGGLGEVSLLDNVLLGNVDQVLLQLTKNFDQLTDAQQRQVIATIGSRREGNTLATLLQNVATQQRALAATTNNSGIAQERFALIMETLTGRLGQLKVTLEQIGQELISAGLGEVLLIILDSLTLLTEGLGALLIPAFQLFALILNNTVVPAMEILSDLLELLPTQLREVVLALATAGLAFKAFAAVRGTAAAASVAGVASTTVRGADGVFIAGAAVGTARVSRFAKVTELAARASASLGSAVAAHPTAFGLAAAAVVGGGLAYLEYKKIQERAAEAVAITEANVDAATLALIEQGVSFATTAIEAQKYLDKLIAIENTGGFGVSTTEDPILKAIIAAFNQAIEGADLGKPLEFISDEFGIGVDQFAVDVQNFNEEFHTLGDTLDNFTEFELTFSKDRNEILRKLELGTGTAQALREAIISGGISVEDALDIVNGIVQGFSATGTAQNEAFDTIRRALDAAVASDPNITRERVDRLIAAGTLLGQNGEQFAFDELNLSTFGTSNDEIILEAETTFEQAIEQFQFLLIGIDEFSKIVDEELAGLVTIASRAGELGDLDTQATFLKSIGDIQKKSSEAIVERIDQGIAVDELIQNSELTDAQLVAELEGVLSSGQITDKDTLFELLGRSLAAQQEIAIQAIADAGASGDLGAKFEVSPGAQAALLQLGITAEPRIGNAEEIIAARDTFNTVEEGLLAAFALETGILQATFGDDIPPDIEIARLVKILNNPAFTNSEERLEFTKLLADLFRDITNIEDDLVTDAITTARELAEALNVEELITAELIFQELSGLNSAISLFLTGFATVTINIANIILRTASEFAASTGDIFEGTRAAILQRIAQLQGLISLSQSFGGDGSFQIEQIADLNEILAGLDRDLFVPAPAGGGFTPRVSSGGSSGGGSDTGVTEFQILQARLAVQRAIAAGDPVRLAQIAQEEAQLAFRFAENEVERLQAQAAIIEADNSFASAIVAAYSAQVDLAIAIANQAGDIELALQLGVEQAEEALFNLRLSGAGDASIAQAQAAIIAAEAAQTSGLIAEQLSDLQFLFDIGDLTVAQFVAQLEAILAAVDPVAQEDLYQQLVRQLLSLEDVSNDLRFNLPDSVFPSFLAVRQLAQGLGPQALTGGTNIDNRTVTITFNVEEGFDWEAAAELLADASGINNQNFAFNVKRY